MWMGRKWSYRSGTQLGRSGSEPLHQRKIPLHQHHWFRPVYSVSAWNSEALCQCTFEPFHQHKIYIINVHSEPLLNSGSNLRLHQRKTWDHYINVHVRFRSMHQHQSQNKLLLHHKRKKIISPQFWNAGYKVPCEMQVVSGVGAKHTLFTNALEVSCRLEPTGD